MNDELKKVIGTEQAEENKEMTVDELEKVSGGAAYGGKGSQIDYPEDVPFPFYKTKFTKL